MVSIYGVNGIADFGFCEISFMWKEDNKVIKEKTQSWLPEPAATETEVKIINLRNSGITLNILIMFKNDKSWRKNPTDKKNHTQWYIWKYDKHTQTV